MKYYWLSEILNGCLAKRLFWPTVTLANCWDCPLTLVDHWCCTHCHVTSSCHWSWITFMLVIKWPNIDHESWKRISSQHSPAIKTNIGYNTDPWIVGWVVSAFNFVADQSHTISRTISYSFHPFTRGCINTQGRLLFSLSTVFSFLLCQWIASSRNIFGVSNKCSRYKYVT